MKLLFLLALAGCATIPPATAQVEITKDCRNPTTETVVYGKSADIILAKGEKRCLFLKTTSSSCIAPPKGVLAFEARTITTTVPSWNGGALGTFIDPLVPATCILNKGQMLIEVTSDADPVTRIGDATINVKVLNAEMPKHPKRPILVAAGNWAGVKGLCNGVWCSREVFVAKELSETVQAHFMTPYDHHVIKPPVLNGKLDLLAPAPGMSGNDTFIKYAHPEFTFIPNPAWGINFVITQTNPALYTEDEKYRAKIKSEFPAYLQAVEATIKERGLVGKAYMYVEDEPEGFGTLDSAILKLQDVRKHAPSLKTLVTVTPGNGNSTTKPKIDQIVSMTDYPVIINSHFTQKPTAPNFMMYLSCESNGCGNNRAWTNLVRGNPGDDLRIADWGAIERPSAYIRAFTWLMIRYDAKAGLYFNTLEHMNIFPAVDPFKDIFNWGGNGDGVLIYPIASGKEGQTRDIFAPSLRLKLASESIQDMFYLEQMTAAEKSEFDTIVVSNKIFSTGYSQYENFINKIKNRMLGGVVTPTPVPPTPIPVPPTPTPTPVPPTPTPTPVPAEEEVDLSITVKCVKRGKSMICK